MTKPEAEPETSSRIEDTTRTAKVSILGVEYTLKGAGATDQIVQVGKFVDERMRHAQTRTDQPHDLGRIAILTSLNIAYELFAYKAEAQQELAEIRHRASTLADALDRCIGDDGAPPIQ
jgi:cell division protein ZapA (FtsZ GTPase activity inhibitor)